MSSSDASARCAGSSRPRTALRRSAPSPPGSLVSTSSRARASWESSTGTMRCTPLRGVTAGIAPRVALPTDPSPVAATCAVRRGLGADFRISSAL
jgi:hypothetical protein